MCVCVFTVGGEYGGIKGASKLLGKHRQQAACCIGDVSNRGNRKRLRPRLALHQDGMVHRGCRIVPSDASGREHVPEEDWIKAGTRNDGSTGKNGGKDVSHDAANVKEGHHV